MVNKMELNGWSFEIREENGIQLFIVNGQFGGRYYPHDLLTISAFIENCANAITPNTSRRQG